jgi:tRNA (adenine57-N1/adenine58-N1)-methyltransferase catalytic subunit
LTESNHPRGRHFKLGDRVHIVDSRDRHYLITLLANGEFHTHAGLFAHAELLGQPEGTTIALSRGMTYTCLHPTLEDFVLKMPRGAQVIYPKDIGPILILADIFPGCRVLESGVGSGALSSAMLRVGAEIIGYELREDFANRAKNNVESLLGAEVLPRYRVELRDCYEGIDERDMDRVVLDLPEPWRVVPHAELALHPGGILLAYTPSITQAVQVRQAMDKPGWILPRTMEVLNRGWYIEGQAVRPDHRMVAHTGFLTTGRWIGEGAQTITPVEREAKPRAERVPYDDGQNVDGRGDDVAGTENDNEASQP